MFYPFPYNETVSQREPVGSSVWMTDATARVAFHPLWWRCAVSVAVRGN